MTEWRLQLPGKVLSEGKKKKKVGLAQRISEGKSGHRLLDAREDTQGQFLDILLSIRF